MELRAKKNHCKPKISATVLGKFNRITIKKLKNVSYENISIKVDLSVTNGPGDIYQKQYYCLNFDTQGHLRGYVYKNCFSYFWMYFLFLQFVTSIQRHPAL